MSRRQGQYLFAFAVGLAVALFSYRWITNPEPRMERALQESVVAAAREHLVTVVEYGDLEIVDPLAPQRRIGKVYVYREDTGWAVSGYYRRDEDDKWHPYLASLGPELQLTHLKIGDPALLDRAANDPMIDASP